MTAHADRLRHTPNARKGGYRLGTAAGAPGDRLAWNRVRRGLTTVRVSVSPSDVELLAARSFVLAEELLGLFVDWGDSILGQRPGPRRADEHWE